MPDVTQQMKETPLDVVLRSSFRSMLAFRIRLFFAGIIFPIGCFVAALETSATINVPWQSGRIADYVAMLLAWPGYGPFLPLVIFSQTCLATWLIRPDTECRLMIRLGIYTGLLVSLQFLLFVVITSSILTFIVAIFVGPIFAVIVAGFVRLPQFLRRFTIRHVMILTAAVAVTIAVGRWLGVTASVFSESIALLMYVVMAAPVLCVWAYVRATIAVAGTQIAGTGYQPWHWLAAILAWIVSWGIAWKLAVDTMLAEYAKLPTTDPNCYVSAAAAHGHPRLVGTEHANGPVNLQMRKLKFLEITLQTGLPRVHRWIRRAYDQIGPVLADQCRGSIWFADATYLMLKPIEYSSDLLRVLLRIRRCKLERLYCGRSPGG